MNQTINATKRMAPQLRFGRRPQRPVVPLRNPHTGRRSAGPGETPLSRSPTASGSAWQIVARKVHDRSAIVRYGTLWLGWAQLEYGAFGINAPFIPKHPVNLAQGGLHLGRREDGRDHV